MSLAVKGLTGTVDKVLPEAWNQPLNRALVHQVVKACEARLHVGTSKQKTRSEVSGGGKKPFRQKGTGRARAGTIRSPLWRGGGVVFANNGERSPLPKVNKKMYRGAMRSVLAEKTRNGQVSVVEAINVGSNKTKDGHKYIETLGFDSSRILFIVNEVEEQSSLALKNIKTISFASVNQLTPLALLKAKQVIFDAAALDATEGWLS